MSRWSLSSLSFVALLLATFAATFHETRFVHADDSAAGHEVVLKAADLSAKLIPATVFFRGQTAPTQLRNSAGIHFPDGLYALATLVDSSGYSTGVREKYQGYLLSEVPLDFGGQTLPPGAYGFGFLNGGKLVVMDLGAHDVFQAGSQRDTELKRPVPLQIIPAAGGAYRLYVGRDFVEFHRSK